MAGSEHEPANSSSPEEEEDEELSSDSESDETPDKPQLPDPTIKPMDQAKKPRSKRPAPPPEPAADSDTGDSKRVKKPPAPVVAAVAAPDAAEDNSGGEKKQLFQRLWSEDNEIELIQGMINYVAEKGKDPLTDVNGFYEFVKRSLHVDVNDRQVLTKARRLKKKFLDNAARVESKGKVRSFSKPHEKIMYELSKTLWANANGGVVNNENKTSNASCSKKVKVKVNVTPKTNKIHNGKLLANEKSEKRVGFGLMGLAITDEVIINKGLELVLGEKKVEMEEKWRNLKVLELEHFLKKVEVLKEQAEVVLNAIEKSGAK